MHSAWADQLVAARRAGRALPVVSADHPEATLDDAFVVQRQVVEALSRDSAIAGYKAALTAPAAQAAFGVDQAVWGVLLAAPLESGDVITISDFANLMLETEVAYRVGTRIDAPVVEDNLAGCFDQIAPAVELADTGFDGKSTGLDLVAGNSASAAFLVGPALSFGDIAPDDVDITLARNGERLHGGNAGDAPGGQLGALAWLVNQVVAGGYTLEPGHWLITGAIGGMQPGQPGHYTADYGVLGAVEFNLV